MLLQPMMEKPRAMRLHGMAEGLQAQQQDTAARELDFAHLDRRAKILEPIPQLRADIQGDVFFPQTGAQAAPHSNKTVATGIPACRILDNIATSVNAGIPVP
jgi:hypothetical protein